MCYCVSDTFRTHTIKSDFVSFGRGPKKLYVAMVYDQTLAARGLEEHVRITLIFSRIISFMLREFIILKNS